jgi:hypothetical protein
LFWIGLGLKFASCPLPVMSGGRDPAVAAAHVRFAPKATVEPSHFNPPLRANCVINALQQISAGLGNYFALWSAGGTAGKRTVNTEPLPDSLATVTSPPIMRASLREMARPSPVPP